MSVNFPHEYSNTNNLPSNVNLPETQGNYEPAIFDFGGNSQVEELSSKTDKSEDSNDIYTDYIKENNPLYQKTKENFDNDPWNKIFGRKYDNDYNA